MSRRACIFLPAQAVCFGCAVLMAVWAGTPWAPISALSLLGISAMVPNLVSSARRDSVLNGVLLFAAVLSCLLLLVVVLPRDEWSVLGSYFDRYYGAQAGLITAGIYLAAPGKLEAGCRGRRNGLVLAWALLGFGLWLAGAYFKNLRVSFYLALLGIVGLLVLCHFWFRLGKLGIQAINTLILLLVGIPIVDLLMLPPYSLRTNADTRRSFYSFKEAKANPAAFARWWSFYLGEWDKVEEQITILDPERQLPYRLRPNSHAMLLQSRISINSHGFRGKEFALDKGDAYRIVTLGESSTFGITLNAEDRPWPELLEELIRKRLKPRRPVEVINGGVFGYTLDNNVHRFARDILPLKPDMVISYHGVNGFILLNPALPSTYGASRVPVYQRRPVRLLANCEYRFKLARFRREEVAGLRRQPRTLVNPMETACAGLYRCLCRIAATNHIRLVLADFSMALNRNSSRDAFEFYEVAYPAAPWQVPANEAQTEILRQVVRENPGVLFLDTHPNLDGVPKNFLDLVHFNPAGEKQMAENMFAVLRPVLEEALSEPEPGNVTTGK